ncbi:MAG: tripartite tricarboxylate transporter substrate binding protein [Burkholderiales bacterium]|nr:tripartite tricarboxylate transporter substrate binding protein [Burkholderiales bacterium]NBO76713.1 tripartite tricarboxylate transporter substrate binding protein [Betaproteobacteria bacterium]
MITRHLFIRFAAAAAALGLGTAALAQDSFPNKEIRLVVPWNPGGSNDIAARALADILMKKGVRVIVENVPGATGSIGMQKVANAPADGYTIGMGTSSTLALIAQRLTPLRSEQFAPIARVTSDPLTLLVPANSPTGTLEAFLANLKKNSGKVSVGTPGSNNLNHIFAVMAGRVADAEVNVIPYTGGSKVIADLAGKQIDAAVLKPGESKAQIDGGLVKPIGVFANERLKVLPDVPTFKEKGHDVFPYGPLVQMAYLVAPAKVPADVLNRLTKLFQEAIQSAEFKAVAAQGGALVDDLTGAALAAEVTAVEKSLAVVAKQIFVAEKK